MTVARKSVAELDAAGKRCLVRADFNVPFEPGTLNILDDSRIRESLPTVSHLLGQGASVVICTHLGRPKGRAVAELRVEPALHRLSRLLGADVIYAGGPGGPGPAAVAAGLRAGQVAMLENLRFDPGEEANDAAFADGLASLADLFVNDAFGVAHRAHASTVGVAGRLPAFAGLLMTRELDMLGSALKSPPRPAIAIIGGAKVADKIGMIDNLLKQVDRALIGGGMVAAFLAAQGWSGGAAKPSHEEVAAAGRLLASHGERIVTPSDVVAARELSADSPPFVRQADDLTDDALPLDVGPDTAAAYAQEIGRARTALWNGPMGVAELEPFSAGTRAVANAMAGNRGLVSIIGGGSTAEAVSRFSLASKMTHVSTGGGASLQFLEGKTLPGVAALDPRD